MASTVNIPATPPAAVLAEVYAAYRRITELAERGTEVDFGHDAAGHLAITLRDAAGERRLRPSDALFLLD
jgi:hypothetical protein